MSKKRKLWRYRAGRRPHSVTVEELETGGNLYVRIWIPARADYQYRSLRHRDRKRAMHQADQLALARQEGRESALTDRITLKRLFALYRRFHSPHKKREGQTEDDRRAELFQRVFGPTKDPMAISLAEWQHFIRLRQSGGISPRGESVPEGERKPVGPRSIQAELAGLRSVLTWGTNWRVEGGGYLLSENPVRGYPMPREKNPRRPVASLERYEAIRAAAPRVTMEVIREGKRVLVRTYLLEILEILMGTGRRVSAVLQLRYSDLQLDQGPHGSILWPAATDKCGYSGLVPVSPMVREALDRVMSERPGIGAAYLFPARRDPSRPERYETARVWLLAAESLAGLPKMDGSSFHAYRRAWATARKHLPDVDVAAAGGWKDANTLRTVYQQSDPETMLKVVLEGSDDARAG